MSDLQIVLIVIGGVIIAAVLLFNWWQERKFHQQIDKNFSAFHQEIPDITPDISLDNTDSFTADAMPSLDDEEFTIEPQRIADEDREPSITAFQSALETEEDTLSGTLTQQEPEAIDAANEVPDFAKHDDIKAVTENPFDEIAAQTNIVATETENDNTGSEPAAGSLPDMLHSQVDWAALLYLQGAASVQDVLASIKEGFSHYDKPTFVHVLTDQGWLLLAEIADKVEYSQLAVSKICCSIQLADRAGAISRSLINRFQLAVETLGLDMNAHVEWQNAGDALNDANALDQFCIEVDKTMGFHLLHGESGAFTGTKLRGLAEAQGMTLSADGTFKFYDENTQNANADKGMLQPSFVMFNRDHYPFNIEMLRSSVVKSITFQLDIPHVSNAIEAFNTMVLVARQMETGLNAQLVDDKNRPLTDVQIEKIRHQLKVIQATMLTRGIAPGSDCARRLFS